MAARKKKKAKDFFSLFFFCLRQSCGGENYKLFPLKKGNCEKYRYVGPSSGKDWTTHKKTRSHGRHRKEIQSVVYISFFQDRFLCCPKWETQGYMWHLSHDSAGGQKPPSPLSRSNEKKTVPHIPSPPTNKLSAHEKNKETFVLFVSHLLTNASSFFPGKIKKGDRESTTVLRPGDFASLLLKRGENKEIPIRAYPAFPQSNRERKKPWPNKGWWDRGRTERKPSSLPHPFFQFLLGSARKSGGSRGKYRQEGT